MIWGYHYFRNPPLTSRWFFATSKVIGRIFFLSPKISVEITLEVPYFGSNTTSPFDWCGFFFLFPIRPCGDMLLFFNIPKPTCDEFNVNIPSSRCHHKESWVYQEAKFFAASLLRLMEELLHHLECIKPYEKWDIVHIKWCRISSINTMTLRGNTGSSLKSLMNFGVCTGPSLHQCSQLRDA